MAEKALEILQQLAAGAAYMDMKGKRMAHNREIVSIPVGYSHRLV